MPPNKPDFKALATSLFETHPQTEVFYFTSDANAFKIKHEAYNHSEKLKDKTITEIYRHDLSAAEIKTLKTQQESELQQGAEAAYHSAFPELAMLIDYNKSTNRK